MSFAIPPSSGWLRGSIWIPAMLPTITSAASTAAASRPALEDAGAKPGDTVVIGQLEFEWEAEGL